MDNKIKNAAIILIGLGERAANEILKSMTPKEVRSILEAINSIDSVSDAEVLQALNDFFRESNGGIDASSKEQIKNSILMNASSKGLSSIIQSVDPEDDKWLELLREQSVNVIVDMVQDEHPQVLTALVIIVFNYLSSEKGTKLIKMLDKETQAQIFKRMTSMGSLSQFGIDALSIFVQNELSDSDDNNVVSLDGLEAVANIISYLDSETEHTIMNELANENKEIGEKIQDKVFPFQRLAELDKKSMQILLAEINNDDMVLALKGVDEHVKNAFMQNMSSKSAEILKDEMESKGPVKLATVIDAQKKIIRIAKKLDEEEKIILSSKNNPDVVY